MSTGTKRTKGKMSTKRTKKNTESTMNRKGNEAPVEVTPETVVDMLGAPAHPDGEVTRLAGRPGVAVGLCRTAAGGCDVVFVEATRMPGSRALTLTGRLGRPCRSRCESRCRGRGPTPDDRASTRLSIGTPTCICTCGRARSRRKGRRPVTMVAALVSAFSGGPVRGDLAMTGDITLSGQVLPVAGIE
jgi:ATP-dependent Lon protease